MWAAAEDHLAAVKTLLAAGADVKKVSVKNETALFFAVRTGDIALVDALLDAGAEVNANSARRDEAQPCRDTMLVTAIVNGHFALADHLLNKGADPNAAGTRWPPLHALVRIRNYEESQYPAPKTATTIWTAWSLPGDCWRMEPIQAQGPCKNGQAQSGRHELHRIQRRTPFFLAAKGADIPMMRLLLSAKADYTTPIDEHTTPLMVAAGVGCVPGQWLEPERESSLP